MRGRAPPRLREAFGSGVPHLCSSPWLEPGPLAASPRKEARGVVFPVSRVRLSEVGSLLGEPRARSEPGALNMTAAKERRRPEGSRWAGKGGRLEELGRPVGAHV